MLGCWGQDSLTSVRGGRSALFRGENTGKQDGTEKDKGHGGNETSKPGDMLAMSCHLLDDEISKREVSGFWARRAL